MDESHLRRGWSSLKINIVVLLATLIFTAMVFGVDWLLHHVLLR